MENGFVQENFYDGEFLRAGIKTREDSSQFVFYQGELLTESTGEGSPRSRHILGYGVAASEVDGATGYHAYHLDEQNSTVYITGSQKQVENAYAYDAFGGSRGHAGELLNRTLYTGQQYDQELGQYYLRARYYNPVLGRFTQEDVYRGDGLNLYAYCDNNPIVYYDDEGNSKKKIKPGATGGAYNQVAANEGEIHHMPADSTSPYGTGAGPGIRMEPEDHQQTNSWGYSKEAQEYQQKQKDLIADGKFKEAQQMDIDDVKSKFPDKYDTAISEMESYTDELLEKRPVEKELEKKAERDKKKAEKEEENNNDEKCK